MLQKDINTYLNKRLHFATNAVEFFNMANDKGFDHIDIRNFSLHRKLSKPERKKELVAEIISLTDNGKHFQWLN